MTAVDLTAADLLAVQATLTAGGAPADALDEVSSSPVLASVRSALRAGVGLPAIAADMAPAAVRRRGRPTVTSTSLPPAAAALVRAMAMAEVVGAPAGPAVQRVLDAVRAGVRLQALIRIRSAQAVVSARFLIALPLLAAAALALLDAQARAFLTSPLGRVVLVLAGILIGLASVWIRRLLTGIAQAGSQADPLVADQDGRDPVLPTAVAVGLLATVAAGPVLGVTSAVVLRLLGPLALRHLRRGRADGSPGGTAAPARIAARVTPDHAGGLPTVEGIELLALALSAGVGLAAACRLAAQLGPREVRPAMADVAARLGGGADPVHAFPAQLAELGHLIDLTHRWGAPTAEALRLLAGDLRDRAATAAEEAAERLTVQLVFPTTLLLVPAFGLLVVAPLVASSLSGVGLGP